MGRFALIIELTENLLSILSFVAVFETMIRCYSSTLDCCQKGNFYKC